MKASSMIIFALYVVVCQFAMGCAELEPMELDPEDCNEVDGQIVCLMVLLPELAEDDVESEYAATEYTSLVPLAVSDKVLPTAAPEPRPNAGNRRLLPDAFYQDDDRRPPPEDDMALCPQRYVDLDGVDQCLVEIVPVEEPYEFVSVECVYEPCTD